MPRWTSFGETLTYCIVYVGVLPVNNGWGNRLKIEHTRIPGWPAAAGYWQGASEKRSNIHTPFFFRIISRLLFTIKYEIYIAVMGNSKLLEVQFLEN